MLIYLRKLKKIKDPNKKKKKAKKTNADNVDKIDPISPQHNFQEIPAGLIVTEFEELAHLSEADIQEEISELVEYEEPAEEVVPESPPKPAPSFIVKTNTSPLVAATIPSAAPGGMIYLQKLKKIKKPKKAKKLEGALKQTSIKDMFGKKRKENVKLETAV